MCEEMIKKGIELFNDEEYEKAKMKFLSVNQHSVAQYYLGAIYRMGLGVMNDQKEAFNWFLKAANQGHMESQYLVAGAYACRSFIYSKTDLVKYDHTLIERKGEEDVSIWQDDLPDLDLNGLGVIPSDEEAFKWMKISSEQGYVNAYLSLGDFYNFGIGVQKDKNEAFRWYKKAAEKDNTDALRRVAYVYYEHGDFMRAIEMYKRAYHLGDGYAAFTIGRRYEKTDSNNRDYQEALTWYLISADEFNYFEAYLKIGNFYYEGKGIEKDIQKAITYYKKAISAYESTNAFGYLDVAYEKLIKLSRDGYPNVITTNEIIEYLEHRSNYGYDSERNLLRDYYDKGYMVTEKTKDMFELLEKAERGDQEARIKYGNTYLSDSFIETPEKLKLREWYLEAAAIGDADAQYLLSKTYTGGETYTEYIFWLRKAADQGHPLALYKLANFYIDKDIEKSLKYLTLSSRSNVEAQIDLGYRYAHGNQVRKDYYEAYRLYQLAASNMRKIKDIIFLRRINYVKFQFNAANDEAELMANQKDVGAQLYMGCLYQYGFEVKRNLEKAIYWYEQASLQGSIEAKKQLEIIKTDHVVLDQNK